jgi:SAM-dependent methyltransferase
MRPQLYEDIYRAELTHWWFRSRLRIVTALLRRFAPARRPLHVADVGCGMGATFHALSQFGRVVGVDPSDTALGCSLTRGHPWLVSGALPALPFADGSFDVVCALDVIEHLDDDRAAARELWRICAPGALLAVTVPAYPWLWSDHDEINDHKRRYTRQRLSECLSFSDGEVVRFSFMNVVLAPPVMIFRLVKNLLVRRRPGRAVRSDVFLFPAPINALLEAMFSSEVLWLRHGSFPFGCSLICVLRKRPAASPP